MDDRETADGDAYRDGFKAGVARVKGMEPTDGMLEAMLGELTHEDREPTERERTILDDYVGQRISPRECCRLMNMEHMRRMWRAGMRMLPDPPADMGKDG